ncbi:hypothetical protein PROFUN_11817, partial [Planoprotostelium fungivorum]
FQVPPKLVTVQSRGILSVTALPHVQLTTTLFLLRGPQFSQTSTYSNY